MNNRIKGFLTIIFSFCMLFISIFMLFQSRPLELGWVKTDVVSKTEFIDYDVKEHYFVSFEYEVKGESYYISEKKENVNKKEIEDKSYIIYYFEEKPSIAKVYTPFPLWEILLFFFGFIGFLISGVIIFNEKD